MVMEERQCDMELDSERVPVPQVQKSVEDDQIEPIDKDISRVKSRIRKKALHAAILKQMEFYFGDANLNKDRFLNSLLKEDPYVDLSVFLEFNKIKELTNDTTRIAKALEGSTMLSLSEDGMKVRRVTPIVPKENTEECTIYVQNLPPDMDHERLIAIFSQYGQVDYVSIPRFKNNRKIKGFAFVEFDTPENAKKCLKTFQKKGCVLPSYTTPDELLSITTFEENEEEEQAKQDEEAICTENVDREIFKEDEVNKITEKQEENSNTEEVVNDDIVEDVNANDTIKDVNINNTMENVSTNNAIDNHESKNKKKAKKRKHRDAESSELTEAEKQSDGESMKKKKLKHINDVHNKETESNNEKHNDTSTVDGMPKKTNKRNRKVSINEEQMSDNCDENEQVVTDDSAVLTTEEQENANEKKRKRKKRKKRSKIEDFSYSIGLQVMAKKEWKYLRNKYLQLQKSKMKQLKQHLRKTRWNQWSNYERNKFEKEENEEKEKASKQETTISRNFSFTPGVIVKIEMDKPCTDPRGFKVELRNNSFIKYIDVEDGSSTAYVRCDTNEAAQAFTQKSDEERHMAVLEGEEEKMYWDKILRDRQEKLSTKVKCKQRGRTKLLKKAEKELGKHIRFDEV